MPNGNWAAEKNEKLECPEKRSKLSQLRPALAGTFEVQQAA
jgi:hypothetical protein